MKPPRKRRRFDPDPAVANPLIPLDTTTSAPPSSTLPAGTIPAALRFHETHDLATLRDLPPVETNRAPVMTAWALVIAERMGFDRMEALSLGESSVALGRPTDRKRRWGRRGDAALRDRGVAEGQDSTT